MVNRTSKRKVEQKTYQKVEPKATPTLTDFKPKIMPAYGFTDKELPEKMRVPYIHTRYRRPCLSVEQCIESMFQPHNETVNIWSHFIAAFVFLIHNSDLLREYRNFDDPLVAPLACCAVGIVVLFFVSACTHLFNSMSLLAYHVCYFCDYAAISICTFTTAQAMFFYSRPISTSWRMFNSPIAFLGFAVMNSLLSTFTCCAVLVRRPWYHAFVRTSAYLSLGLFTVLPYLGRLAFCSYTASVECTTPSYIHFKRYCLYFTIAGVTYANRIPERLFPKMFDLLGQSHHILHVLSAMALSEIFTAVHIDMMDRKESLMTKPYSWLELCAVFTLTTVVINIGVVFWFSRSLKRRLQKLRNVQE